MKTKQKIKVEIVDQDTPIKGFWIDTILTACGQMRKEWSTPLF